jgi:hypothetical protein
VAVIVAGLLFAGSSALADPPVPPSDPPELEDADHADPGPPGGTDHTAQDSAEQPPEEHTAQDGKNPDNKPYPDGRDTPLSGSTVPGTGDKPSFTSPLIELLDQTTPRMPDARSYFDGADGEPLVIVDQADGSIRMLVPFSGTTSSVPSPGALVLIGLGALMLNRRRRC